MNLPFASMEPDSVSAHWSARQRWPRGAVVAVAIAVTGSITGCGGGSVADVVIAADTAERGNDANEPLSGSVPLNDNGSGPSLPGQVIGLGTEYRSGEPFRINPAAAPVVVSEACRSHDNNGRVSFSMRALRFDPASARFLVDGGLVLDGGFTWAPSTREFVAQRNVPIGTATGQYFAKVNSTGRPTYYRYKLTLANGDFQQIECYQGITG